MALPVTIAHTGSLNGSPAVGGQNVPSLNEIINTTFSGTYGASKSARLSIVGATDISPYTLSLDTMTKARCLVVATRSQTVKVLLTSAVGTDQKLDISGLFLWHSPNAGDEITAIKFVGTADLEVFVAGDVL